MFVGYQALEGIAGEARSIQDMIRKEYVSENITTSYC